MMKQTALITGGSHGIGFELARVFAANGYGLILVARDGTLLLEAKKAIEKESGAVVSVVSMDLSHPKAAKALYDFTNKRKIRVDVLVNNAGFGIYGKFSEIDIEKEKEMVMLNVMTLMELTRLYLPGMIRRKNGKILNLSSIAGMVPTPNMAAYGASKAFVLSFTRALNNELKGSGVHAMALCPGATRTNFHKRAGIKVSALVRASMMDPEPVAREAYAALMGGKSVLLPGFKNKAMAKLALLAPRDLLTDIVGKFQEARG